MKKTFYAAVIGFSLMLIAANILYCVTETDNPCYLCGNNKYSLMSAYRGRNSVGILRMNTFDISDVGMTLTDVSSDENSKNQIHIVIGGEGYGMIKILPDREQGISCVRIDLGEKDLLDMETARERLCDSCFKELEKQKKEIGEDMIDIFLVDFKTARIYSLADSGQLYVGDYQVIFHRKSDVVEGIIKPS